jgi:O-antigen ligase
MRGVREWFAVGFLWYLVSPLLGYIGAGLKLQWILYAIWLFLMYYKRPQAFAKTIVEVRRRSIECFMPLIWWYVILLNILFSHGLTGGTQLVYCTTWLMILFMEVSLTAQYDGSSRRIAMRAITVIAAECLWSLPHMLTMPTLARMSTGGSSDYIAEASLAGIGEYGYYVALAMSVPVLLGLVVSVRSRLSRLLYLVLVVGVAVTVSLATFMGAALLMMGGGTLFVALSWTRSKTRKYSWGLVVLIAIAILVWQTSLSHTAQGSFVANKVVLEIKNIRIGGLQSETTGRVQLNMLSIASFERSPLIGVGPYTTVRQNSGLYVLVGGHSSWLDQLAEYGLLGFLPVVVFLLLRTMRVLRSVTSKSVTNEAVAHLVTVIVYIGGGIFNPVLFVPSIRVVVFMLAPGVVPMNREHQGAVTNSTVVAEGRG